ncbi:hypothetical protein ACLKA6_018053 [Drosophila palustris]
MASCFRDFENRTCHNAYLPPFIGGYVEESFQQTVTMAVTERGTETDRGMEREAETETVGNYKNKQQVAKESENPFWISVSGYQLEKVGLVYRFFLDIGHVADQIFTESNSMYLKYSSFTDCEIAVSYDGQKIGYGGDILVRVKPENPMIEHKIEEVHKIDNSEACVIDMERVKPQQQLSQIVAEKTNRIPIDLSIPRPNRSAPKLGFLQWLKQKVSYMFYFY